MRYFAGIILLLQSSDGTFWLLSSGSGSCSNSLMHAYMVPFPPPWFLHLQAAAAPWRLMAASRHACSEFFRQVQTCPYTGRRATAHKQHPKWCEIQGPWILLISTTVLSLLRFSELTKVWCNRNIGSPLKSYPNRVISLVVLISSPLHPLMKRDRASCRGKGKASIMISVVGESIATVPISPCALLIGSATCLGTPPGKQTERQFARNACLALLLLAKVSFWVNCIYRIITCQVGANWYNNM